MALAQPAIEFLGVRINEPVTTFTDLMVSAVCFYAFFKLSQITMRNKVHLYLRYYFLSMGIATAIGGLIGHGFLYLFDARWETPDFIVNFLTPIVGSELLQDVANPWKLPGWLTSMFSIALVERAAIEYARPLTGARVGKFLSWLNIIELTTFVIITFTTLNFFFVEVHSAYGLLFVVTSLCGYVFWKTRAEGSKLFLIAVGISAVSALIYMNEWGISKWFNHFDISHIFMTASAYTFYLGGKRILTDPILTAQNQEKNNHLTNQK